MFARTLARFKFAGRRCMRAPGRFMARTRTLRDHSPGRDVQMRRRLPGGPIV